MTCFFLSLAWLLGVPSREGTRCLQWKRKRKAVWPSAAIWPWLKHRRLEMDLQQCKLSITGDSCYLTLVNSDLISSFFALWGKGRLTKSTLNEINTLLATHKLQLVVKDTHRHFPCTCITMVKYFWWFDVKIVISSKPFFLHN